MGITRVHGVYVGSVVIPVLDTCFPIIWMSQVLSRDSVTVSVDAVVYYRVNNPIMATNNVEDYRY